jgi:hypothetical protein
MASDAFLTSLAPMLGIGANFPISDALSAVSSARPWTEEEEVFGPCDGVEGKRTMSIQVGMIRRYPFQQQQLTKDPVTELHDTTSDAMIAAILAEDESSHDNHEDDEPSTSEDEEAADERFDWATAMAIVESFEEADQTDSSSQMLLRASSTSGPASPPTVLDAHTNAISVSVPPLQHQRQVQQTTCPICFDDLSSDPETDDSSPSISPGNGTLRTFCPACTQAFHNSCLARWFTGEREDSHRRDNCPTCRTMMEEDFIEEVKSL